MKHLLLTLFYMGLFLVQTQNIFAYNNDKNTADSIAVASDYAEFKNKLPNPQEADWVTEEICKQLHLSEGDYLKQVFLHRNVYLVEEVNDYTASYLSFLLLALEKKSHDTITIYIDSPGGCALSGLGLCDTMGFISSPVKTVCTGMAASMAAVIFSSGNHGLRYIKSSSRIMIHAPKEGEAGPLADLKTDVEKVAKELYEILSKNTGKPFDTIKQDCKKDFWMSAEEAVKYGMADKIIR